MSETKTLRDELAMNAPEIATISTEEAARILGRPEPPSGTVERLDWWCEITAVLRYRWADMVLRVRAETMPKEEGEPKFDYEAWKNYMASTGSKPTGATR